MPKVELNEFQEAVLECLQDAEQERLDLITRDELLQRMQDTPGYDDCHHQKLAPCVKNLRRRGLLDEPTVGKFCITNAGKAALAGEGDSAQRPAPNTQEKPEAPAAVKESLTAEGEAPSPWIDSALATGYIKERPDDSDPGVSVHDVLYPPGGEFLQSREFHRDEICAAFRVPTPDTPPPSAYHVTRLQAVVHRPGRPLDDDDSVIIQLDDNGAGLIVRLSSFGGDPDLVLESAEQIRAVADAAIAMLKEAEGREVSR